jgi:hypothetical protein
MQFGAPVSSMAFSAELLDKPLPASNREVALANDRVLSEFVAKLQRDDIVTRATSAISDCLLSDSLTRSQRCLSVIRAT